MKTYIHFSLTFIFLFALATFCKAEDTSIKSMQFQEIVYDFGEITQGTVVNHDFIFTNKSNQMLIINDVITTCGCTVPKYTKTPIQPDAKDKLTVSFNSKNKMGIQRKTITIKTNQGNYKIRILANVIVAEK